MPDIEPHCEERPSHPEDLDFSIILDTLHQIMFVLRVWHLQQVLCRAKLHMERFNNAIEEKGRFLTLSKGEKMFREFGASSISVLSSHDDTLKPRN